MSASSQLCAERGKPFFASLANQLKSWNMGSDYCYCLSSMLQRLGSLKRTLQEILFAPQPLKEANNRAYPRTASPPSRPHLPPASAILLQLLGGNLESILLKNINSYLEDPKWVSSPTLTLESLCTTEWLLQVGNQISLTGWTCYTSARTEISFPILPILSTPSPWFFHGQVLHTTDQLMNFYCFIFTTLTVISHCDLV